MLISKNLLRGGIAALFLLPILCKIFLGLPLKIEIFTATNCTLYAL